jgi:hypothetical protein
MSNLRMRSIASSMEPLLAEKSFISAGSSTKWIVKHSKIAARTARLDTEFHRGALSYFVSTWKLSRSARAKKLFTVFGG